MTKEFANARKKDIQQNERNETERNETKQQNIEKLCNVPENISKSVFKPNNFPEKL